MRQLRFLITAQDAKTMTRNNLHWILITAPDENGNAQLNIAATNGGQVAITLSGSTAAEIADLLLYEMHGQEYDNEPEGTIH
jgi:hypothetical protein